MKEFLWSLLALVVMWLAFTIGIGEIVLEVIISIVMFLVIAYGLIRLFGKVM